MSAPRLILHVGAPKCGSSALQTALTRQPDHRDAEGRRLRYVALNGSPRRLRPIYGDMVQRLGAASPYGYACWPNFGRQSDAAAILAALRRVLLAGEKGGWAPILSCEGWINHPEVLAGALAEWGHPPVEVVAFLRPPVAWTNASWWQWGIWTVRDVGTWIDRQFLPYSFADNLARWAQIPNLRLRVRRSRPDVLGKFAALYGIDLKEAAPGNAAPPPSLTGFMLRNRRFRATPHDARAEFVFQRWCDAAPGERLWALNPDQVRSLRPVTRHSRDLLRELLAPEDLADVMADPRWTSETPYHDAIRSGASRLHAPEDLPALHAALAAGIDAAARAAGRMPAPLPDPLAPEAPVARWDPLLAEMFDRLLAQDARVRRWQSLRWPLGRG